jgi:hypothetical protein
LSPYNGGKARRSEFTEPLLILRERFCVSSEYRRRP